jgi:hypothetical protein
MSNYTIPGVGTKIPFSKDDAVLSRDLRTWICRISYDAKRTCWIMEKPEDKRGLLVFLNDSPDAWTTHIQISAIQPSGKTAWADVVDMAPQEQGLYD